MGSGPLLRLWSQRRDCLDASKAQEQGECKVADAAETAGVGAAQGAGGTVLGHVLIAADKFKGSLTAVQVAERVTAGLHGVLPDLPVRALPVADGGDGTVDAAVAAGFERREARVTGPLGAEDHVRVAVRGGAATERYSQLRDQATEPTVREGRCLPYGSGVVYWALSEVIRADAGILDEDRELALERLAVDREQPVLLEERSYGTEEDGGVLLVRVDVAAADLDESLRG